MVNVKPGFLYVKLSCWRVIGVRGRLAIFVLIATCFIVFASCIGNEKSKIKGIQRKMDESNYRIEQLEQKLNEKQKEIDQLKAIQNQGKIKTNSNEVRLTYISADNYEKRLTENIITIDEGKTLEENVKRVIEETMGTFFAGAKYEVAFKMVNGKNIAVLNLIDENDSKDWYNAFQGSTGGYINSNIIIENTLQRDYKGKWIDGLQVLYNGSKAEFQHAPNLENIIYK